MGKKGKLIVAVLALAFLAAWYLRSSRDDASLLAADSDPVVATPTSQDQGPAELEDSQAGSERSAVVGATAATDPAPVVDAGLVHFYMYVLVVRTIDEYGLPVASPPVLLSPVRSTLNDLVQTTMRVDGVVIATWRGKQEEMDVDIQCGSFVTTPATQRVSLRAGTACEVVLLCESSVGRQVLEGTPDGRRYLQVDEEHPDDEHFTLAMESGKPLRLKRLSHPHARFADRFVHVHHEPTAEELEWARELRLDLDTMNIEVQGQGSSSSEQILVSRHRVRGLRVSKRRDDSHIIIRMVGDRPDDSNVTIHVIDDRGEPVPSVPVTFGLDIDGAVCVSFTDEHGNATLNDLESGWWEARAGGGPGGLARESLFVKGPDSLHWTARLDRGARIFGRVIDAQGNPAQNLIVRYESIPDAVLRSSYSAMDVEALDVDDMVEHGELRRLLDRESPIPWVDQTAVREDGSFELANLPPGLGRLIVLDKARPEAAALLVEDGVMPSVHELVLHMPVELGRFRLRLQFPKSSPRPNFEVRAISEATGRGTLFVPDEEGGLVCPSLAAGWYRIEVGAGFLGWHDLGRQYVAPGASVDLGSFTPPPPAIVRVIPPAPIGPGAPLDLTFYLRRDDLDLRCEARQQEKREFLLLPGGNYWVFWTTGDGVNHHRSQQLEAGIEFELDLR